MKNKNIIATDGAHIKVMNSYDFGHFEITLGLSGEVTTKMVDDARKDAQRLVDKAIDQYKKAKKFANDCIRIDGRLDSMRQNIESLKRIPNFDLSIEQKALVKAINDHLYFTSREYDYQDDWDDCDPDFGFKYEF